MCDRANTPPNIKEVTAPAAVDASRHDDNIDFVIDETKESVSTTREEMFKKGRRVRWEQCRWCIGMWRRRLVADKGRQPCWVEFLCHRCVQWLFTHQLFCRLVFQHWNRGLFQTGKPCENICLEENQETIWMRKYFFLLVVCLFTFRLTWLLLGCDPPNRKKYFSIHIRRFPQRQADIDQKPKEYSSWKIEFKWDKTFQRNSLAGMSAHHHYRLGVFAGIIFLIVSHRTMWHTPQCCGWQTCAEGGGPGDNSGIVRVVPALQGDWLWGKIWSSLLERREGQQSHFIIQAIVAKWFGHYICPDSQPRRD